MWEQLARTDMNATLSIFEYKNILSHTPKNYRASTLSIFTHNDLGRDAAFQFTHMGNNPNGPSHLL